MAKYAEVDNNSIKSYGAEPDYPFIAPYDTQEVPWLRAVPYEMGYLPLIYKPASQNLLHSKSDQ